MMMMGVLGGEYWDDDVWEEADHGLVSFCDLVRPATPNPIMQSAGKGGAGRGHLRRAGRAHPAFTVA